MTVATLENPTALKPYIVNTEEFGDFPYTFTRGKHAYLVYARDRQEAIDVLDEFLWV